MNSSRKSYNDYVDEKQACQGKKSNGDKENSESAKIKDKHDKWNLSRLAEGWKALPKDIRHSYLLLIFLFVLYTVLSFLNIVPRISMYLEIFGVTFSACVIVIDLLISQDPSYQRFLLSIAIACIFAYIFNFGYWLIPQDEMCEILKYDRFGNILSAVGLLSSIVTNLIENIINFG